MSIDKYTVSGVKSWLTVKGVSFLQKKIEDEDIDDMIDKIDDTFKDDHAIEVMKSLKILVSRIYLRLNVREREIKDGKRKGGDKVPEANKQETKVLQDPKKTKRPVRRRRRSKR